MGANAGACACAMCKIALYSLVNSSLMRPTHFVLKEYTVQDTCRSLWYNACRNHRRHKRHKIIALYAGIMVIVRRHNNGSNFTVHWHWTPLRIHYRRIDTDDCSLVARSLPWQDRNLTMIPRIDAIVRTARVLCWSLSSRHASEYVKRSNPLSTGRESRSLLCLNPFTKFFLINLSDATECRCSRIDRDIQYIWDESLVLKSTDMSVQILIHNWTL